MEITHRTHNLHIAPRKLRLVVDQIRHMPVQKALEILPLVINKGGNLAFKSLKSALQVAKDQNLQVDSLVIQRVWCDEGLKLKRVIGHSRGRMAPIHKHYSHLSIVLKGENAIRPRARRTAKVTEEPRSTSDQPTQIES